MTDTLAWAVVNLTTGETTIEHYASPENVIRYGLSKSKYDAGQYDIYLADSEDYRRRNNGVRAYKRTDRQGRTRGF